MLEAEAVKSPLGWLQYHSPATVTAPYAPYHHQLAELPQPGTAQLRCVFRGAAKTTITSGMVVHAALYRKVRGVLVICATFRDCSDARQQVAELLHQSGHPFDVSVVHERLIINRVPVWFRSPGGAVRGLRWTAPDGEVIRPNLCVVDDIETRDSARSKAQTDKTRDWLFADAFATAGPEHPMAVLMLGTPITPTSIVAQAMRREAPFDQWLEPLIVPIVDDEGVPAWPVVDVGAKQQLASDDSWATEFLLHPLPSGSLVFPPERTVWLPAVPERLRVWIGVDPAGEGEDRTGIVAVGAADAGLVVADAELWAGPAEDRADRVAAMIRRLQDVGAIVAGVTVEAVGEFKFTARHIGKRVAPVQTIHETPRIGKLERAGELTRWHRVGALAMVEALRGSDFDVECHTWTRDGLTVTGHDDGPDAMVWAAGAATGGWAMQPPMRDAA